METLFSRDNLNLEPEDYKGWTALPTVSHHDSDARTASKRPATFDDLDATTLPPNTVIGAPYQPALIHWTEDEGQVIKVVPIIFDEKRECQEFIADHIIGAGFYPTEDFD